jgi:urease accessory protein
MKKIIFTASLALLLPSLAFAHASGHGGGFMGGLTHPIFGLDHFLAMVCVGALSHQIGGRSTWMAPLAFVVAMLVGGIFGMKDVELPGVELGIAISVLTLGIAVAAKKKLPLPLAMLLVAGFAIYHGHAHGAEMPFAADTTAYFGGFLAGAAAIQLAGLFLGFLAGGFSQGTQLLQYLGAGVAGIGFHLIYNL